MKFIKVQTFNIPFTASHSRGTRTPVWRAWDAMGQKLKKELTSFKMLTSFVRF